MSALEETIVKEAAETSEAKAKTKSQPIGNRFLDFISSVRFGIVLLCVMVFLSFLGMIIIQQNVQGFETYFAGLTPAEKWLFGNLGLFDIYHSWYFEFLLLILSLNIILASIDRFPSAWKYISTPKIDASRAWLLNQRFNAKLSMHGESAQTVAEKISAVFRKHNLKTRVSEKNSRVYVFGESGKWNRLGAYVVHVALLTLFLGHFVALQSGFDADVRLMPGQKTSEIQLIEIGLDNAQGLQTQRYNVALPFSITCTDIQQKLIDPKADIGIQNTLDWRTQIKIEDPDYGETIADVQLNRPFSYRGFRFFQASTDAVGNARTMTLELTPQNGGAPLNINLARNGSTTLEDGTKIDYEAFFADFTLANGQADTRSPDYNNPAVKLNITTPAGEKKNAYAFFNKLPDGIPIGAPVAGYKFRLADFEKVPRSHILLIKYDPYHGAFIAWYFGGFGLIAALIFVFFISHKRVWALIQKKDLSENYEIVLGANVNRSHQGFENKFNKISHELYELHE